MNPQKNLLPVGVYFLSLALLSYVSALQNAWYGGSVSFLAELIPVSLVFASENMFIKSLCILLLIAACPALAWVYTCFGSSPVRLQRLLRGIVRITLVLSGVMLLWFTFSSATPVTGLTGHHLILLVGASIVGKRLPAKIMEVMVDVFVF
jgi:hypothetical protein